MSIIPQQNKSAKVLIYANLLPIFGVLFLKWTILDLFFTYWLEAVIIGIVTILKMSVVKDVENIKSREISKMHLVIKRVMSILFFVAHYGIFLMSYASYIFIMGFIGLNGLRIQSLFNSNIYDGTHTKTWSIIIFALGLFISHWFSYKQNFIVKEEFRKTNFSELMIAPYKRLTVVFLTTTLGVLIIGLTLNRINSAIGDVEYLTKISQMIILILFISLKILLDKKSHEQEHLKFKQIL